MKTTLLTRVLTPLAALAVTCGAYGFTVSDGFETETSAAVTNRTNWVFEPGSSGDLEESSEILGYEATGVTAPTARPSQFANDGANYLKLSTEDGKIFFNVNGSEGQATGAGIYLDTVVQFTPTDSGDRPSADNEDKFIIWLESDAAAGTTNLCVLAKEYKITGEDAEATVVANSNKVYKISSPSIEAGSWHRLTVKAAADVNDGGEFELPAFQIFIDGTQVAAADSIFDAPNAYEDNNTFSADPARSGILANYYFPSLTGNIDSLKQVGFAGEGKVDDLVVTSELPNMFPRRVVTVTWGSEISSVIYKLNYDAETGAAAGSGTLTASGSQIVVEPGTTIRFEKSGITTASGTYADYKFGTCTWDGDAASGSVTIDANDTVATIATTTGDGNYGATFALALQANNKVNVTLDYYGLGEAGQAEAISTMQYKVGSGEWTELSPDETAVSIGACDYGTTIEVSVTYNENSTYVNGGWYADPAARATLSGTTFTLGSTPGEVTLYVAAIQPVVTINGQGYADFGDALAAVPTDGTPTTLKLAANVEMNSSYVAANQYVIIDFAGKTITSTSDEEAFFTLNAATSTLVFTNSVETTTAVNLNDATGTVAAGGQEATVDNDNGGTFIVWGGNIKASGWLYSGNKANFAINGGFFDEDYSSVATLPLGYAMEQDATDNLYKLVVHAPWDGEGTELSPYLIDDEEDLEELRDMINAGSYSTNYFAQTKDIALTKSWTGIGSQTNPFKGSYDGKGYAITGLRFAVGTDATDGAYTYMGFFSNVEGADDNHRAVIKDLKISLAENSGTIVNGFDLAEDHAAEYGAALFVGKASYANLTGLTAESGTIEGTHNVAGIAIKALPPVRVVGCTNKVSVIGQYTKMAGLVVFLQNEKYTAAEMVFEDCSNEGSVTGGRWVQSDGLRFAGMDGIAAFITYVGNANQAGFTNVTFKNCRNTGAITSQLTAEDYAKITTAYDQKPLLATFVAYGANHPIGNLGGNTTTATDIPAVTTHTTQYSKLPYTAETGFEFATVSDGTASFVAASSLDMTGATTYKVMVSNKVDVALAAGQSIVFDESIAAAKVSTAVAGYEIAASGETAAKTYALAAIEYTISYADEDGTAYDTTTKWSDTATFPLALYAPTKSGYEFDGWTNATYTTAIKSLATKPAAFGDIALAAKWTVSSSDPVPALPDNPTAENVTNSVNSITGMSDANKAKLNDVVAGDPEKYNEFSSWAANCDGGQVAAVASTYVVESFQVSPVVAASYYLFANEPEVKVTTFEVTGTSTLSLTLELKDGDTQVQLTTVKENLAKCLRKGTDVGAIDTVLTAGEITETVQEGAEKTVTLTVTPTGLGTTGFMKFLAQ